MALSQPAASSASHTQTNVSEPSTDSTHPPLPAPQLFDILPALHEILARIDHRSTDPITGSPSLTDNLSSGNIGAAYNNIQSLDPKDLPTAILPLKTMMRKGLREVEKLPDMERSVQEQEEEIRELEERIRKQELVMRGLGERAREMQGRMGG
ncbi:hypothetical protein KC336_g20042 [Hortaea werneckii]|nr:hypothetical protein KC336_g20042 [Hortaea werneckii]